MQCRLCTGWQGGVNHPLKAVHYTLLCQAGIGLFILIFVFYASLNLGWWTGRGTAAALALSGGGIATVIIPPTRYLIGYVKREDNRHERRKKISVEMLITVLLVSFNGAAAVTMVQRPGKDFKKSFEDPPYFEWYCSTALVYIQCLLSGNCLYGYFVYFLRPGDRRVQPDNVSDTALDDYPTTHLAPQTRASLTRTSSGLRSSENGSRSSPIQDYDNSRAAQTQTTEQQEWSENARNSAEPAAGPSRNDKLSDRARGKRREVHSNGIDELDQGLAFINEDGHSWAPI